MLTTLLGRSDLEAICVTDVTEALRLMERERFSLYMVDLELPGVSGLEFCEDIRKVDRHTPIIIYSEAAYESDREAGYSPGRTSTSSSPRLRRSSLP
jgi:DNA-binding response OmpR family regulator